MPTAEAANQTAGGLADWAMAWAMASVVWTREAAIWRR